MDALKTFRPRRACWTLILALLPLPGLAQPKPDAARLGAEPMLAERDGQHDFDFEIGTWKTHLSRLQNPLTGSSVWTDYDGTTVVRKVWDGRAHLLELEVDGPRGTSKG